MGEEEVVKVQSQATSEEETPVEANEKAPVEKKEKAPNSHKKRNIFIGVCAAVVVLAVAFAAWHEQPSFCNAICHTPMDAYFVTYDAGDMDKFGNDISAEDAKGMMSYAHKADNDVTCLNCHTPTIGEQLNEGVNWITGNYTVADYNKKGYAYLESSDLYDLTEWRGGEDVEFCLNDSCHADITLANLADATVGVGVNENRNPHNAHHGTPYCTDCHKGHSQSVNACTQCHNDAPVPDGWLTSAEANQQTEATNLTAFK